MKKTTTEFLREKGIIAEGKTEFVIKFDDGREVILNDLLFEFYKQKEVPTWISFSERHPTEREEYLVTDGKNVSTMEFDGQDWMFEDGLLRIPMQVPEHLNLTHWMPLPAAPKPAQP